MLPFITSVYDVLSDGNCGFLVLTQALNYQREGAVEEDHHRVHTEMDDFIEQNRNNNLSVNYALIIPENLDWGYEECLGLHNKWMLLMKHCKLI
jgi:hypothetical protein